MIDPILERALNLFTPAEWRAMIWLLLCTVALTHTLKVLWRLSAVKGGNGAGIQVIAIAAGFVSAYLIWPASAGPWYVAGIIAGPSSSVLFKFGFALLTKFMPGLAAAVNFDRRKLDLGPPPATHERRDETETTTETPKP